MKILIINYRYFVSGGPETYMFNLKDLLEEKGHEVIPFSIHYSKNVKTEYDKYFVNPLSNPDEVYYKEQSWNLISLKTSLERSIYSKEVEQKLTTLIKDVKPDFAIVLHYLRKLSPSVLNALKKNGVPFAVRLSDFGMICSNAHLFRNNRSCEICIIKGQVNGFYNRCLHDSTVVSLFNYSVMQYHRLAGYFDAIGTFLCPSRFLMSKMVEAGWDKNRFVYLPTFTDTKEFDSIQKKNQLVFVGRLTEIKGLELLFTALEIIKNKKLSFKFDVLIAGDGEQKYIDKLNDLIKSKNLDNIKLLGLLDKNEIINILKESLISVCPSLWYENLPNSVLESFACKTAVIGPNFGSIPEAIVDNFNGYLYEQYNASDLAEKIVFAFDNQQSVVKMGENGYGYLKRNFSSEAHYKQIMNLIEGTN